MAKHRAGSEAGRAPALPALADGFGRQFRYLRLSITEACNFRCAYCLPDGYRRDRDAQFLSAEEIGRLARGFGAVGVTKVRLTGGEPSVRPDLEAILSQVARAPGIAKVAMTTNGWRLGERVAGWREAGLTHLNVSIDSLDPAAFARITGHDRLPEILEGVEQALGLGFGAVKLNAVLLREAGEDAFAAFAAWVRRRPVTVRFIELMRTLDNVAYFQAQHVRAEVLERWLRAHGWRPTPRRADDGPAVEWSHPDHLGRIGVIAPYADGFCDGCNRLRVTARGQLRLCLFGEGGVDLRDLLADEVGVERLRDRLAAALPTKARGHELLLARSGDLRRMADVGG